MEFAALRCSVPMAHLTLDDIQGALAQLLLVRGCHLLPTHAQRVLMAIEQGTIASQLRTLTYQTPSYGTPGYSTNGALAMYVKCQSDGKASDDIDDVLMACATTVAWDKVSFFVFCVF